MRFRAPIGAATELTPWGHSIAATPIHSFGDKFGVIFSVAKTEGFSDGEPLYQVGETAAYPPVNMPASCATGYAG